MRLKNIALIVFFAVIIFSANQAMAWLQNREGKVTVTLAGTPAAFSVTNQYYHDITICGNKGNAGTVVVGDSNVVGAASNRRGMGLEPGVCLTLGDSSTDGVTGDVKELYADAANGGDQVHFMYRLAK